MSSEKKYVRLDDWLAAKAIGDDPGLRPLGDELLFPSEPLPPTSTRVLGMTSLRPDPEAQRQARSAKVDALLQLNGIRPRRR